MSFLLRSAPARMSHTIEEAVPSSLKPAGPSSSSSSSYLPTRPATSNSASSSSANPVSHYYSVATGEVFHVPVKAAVSAHQKTTVGKASSVSQEKSKSVKADSAPDSSVSGSTISAQTRPRSRSLSPASTSCSSSSSSSPSVSLLTEQLSAFEELLSSILPPVTTTEDHHTTVIEGHTDDLLSSCEQLKEAETMLSQIKQTLFSLSPSARSQYDSRIQSYAKLLSSKRHQLLMNGAKTRWLTDDYYASHSNWEERQEMGKQSLHRLEEARKQVYDSIRLGENVLKNLGEQKETIKKATENVIELNSDVGFANKMINRMNKWWK